MQCELSSALHRLAKQDLDGLPQGGHFTHVAGENHIGGTGEEAFRPGLPDGDAGANLAQHPGALNPQRCW